MLNVLVACEESQTICLAFRELGHNSFSCDLQDCSGGYPQFHIKGDCLPIINGYCRFYTSDGEDHYIHSSWDLLIAHPPCTYLSNSAAQILYKDHTLNIDRLKLGIEASHFFYAFYYSNSKHICIENPVPGTIFCLPQYNQIIDPSYFGHNFKKRTCLWLKNLPPLFADNFCSDPQAALSSSWFNKSSGFERQKNRSKTFPGIAKAMAKQWTSYLER